ncbi:MAG: tetratricopeptide repeat protein [Verrucomicrobiae bacterium]|nr:tetratricopeptide repeat protein [Verrucomicrobiae bacterium]
MAIATIVVVAGCGRSPKELMERGAVLYGQGRFAQAAECFEQALRKAPPTPQALTLLGVCRVRTGRAEDGLRCFEQALKLDPQYAAARFNLAVVYLEQGQLEAAASLLRQVVQQAAHPPEAKTYLALVCNNLGVAAARQRDFARGEKWLREAQMTDPALPEATRNLAALKSRMELSKGGSATAITAVVTRTSVPVKTNGVVTWAASTAAATQTAQGAATAPEPQQVQARRTDVPAVSGQPPASGPVSKRRAAIAPRQLPRGDRQKALVLFNEAVGLQQRGDLASAVQLYQKAVAADASFAAAYYNLAHAYRDLKDTERAFENYELALMADPNFDDARRNYAILLQQQGYIADAVEQYEMILQRHPEDAAIHVTVAGLYAADRATIHKARKHYEAYLKLVPNAPHAAEIRRWLEQAR